MSKSPLQSLLGKRLYDLIASMLGTGLLVRREDPITLADSEPEPDISVVRGSDRDFVTAHPVSAELVVEIAISSVALDRELAALYAEAGVKEYWIALAAERKVEVYRRPEGGRYQEKQTVAAGEVLECSSVPGVRIRLTDLFA